MIPSEKLAIQLAETLEVSCKEDYTPPTSERPQAYHYTRRDAAAMLRVLVGMLRDKDTEIARLKHDGAGKTGRMWELGTECDKLEFDINRIKEMVEDIAHAAARRRQADSHAM